MIDLTETHSNKSADNAQPDESKQQKEQRIGSHVQPSSVSAMTISSSSTPAMSKASVMAKQVAAASEQVKQVYSEQPYWKSTRSMAMTIKQQVQATLSNTEMSVPKQEAPKVKGEASKNNMALSGLDIIKQAYPETSSYQPTSSQDVTAQLNSQDAVQRIGQAGGIQKTDLSNQQQYQPQPNVLNPVSAAKMDKSKDIKGQQDVEMNDQFDIGNGLQIFPTLSKIDYRRSGPSEIPKPDYIPRHLSHLDFVKSIQQKQQEQKLLQNAHSKRFIGRGQAQANPNQHYQFVSRAPVQPLEQSIFEAHRQQQIQPSQVLSQGSLNAAQRADPEIEMISIADSESSSLIPLNELYKGSKADKIVTPQVQTPDNSISETDIFGAPLSAAEPSTQANQILEPEKKPASPVITILDEVEQRDGSQSQAEPEQVEQEKVRSRDPSDSRSPAKSDHVSQGDVQSKICDLAELLAKAESHVDGKLETIETELNAIELEKQQQIKDLMIKDSDVIAPCLKHRNKVYFRPHSDTLAQLKRSENANTDDKLGELINSNLHSETHEPLLPNFTSQADFTMNHTAQRIYKENKQRQTETKRKQAGVQMNNFVVEDTKALSLLSTKLESEGKSMPVDYDFAPANVGLLKMMQVSFSSKKAQIAKFIAKTRTRLAEEKRELEETHQEARECNVQEMLKLEAAKEKLDKDYGEMVKQRRADAKTTESNPQMQPTIMAELENSKLSSTITLQATSGLQQSNLAIPKGKKKKKSKSKPSLIMHHLQKLRQNAKQGTQQQSSSQTSRPEVRPDDQSSARSHKTGHMLTQDHDSLSQPHNNPGATYFKVDPDRHNKNKIEHIPPPSINIYTSQPIFVERNVRQVAPLNEPFRRVDAWTPEQIRQFLEKFFIYRRDFPRIAQFFPHKTSKEMIDLYYAIKKFLGLSSKEKQLREVLSDEHLKLIHTIVDELYSKYFESMTKNVAPQYQGNHCAFTIKQIIQHLSQFNLKRSSAPSSSLDPAHKSNPMVVKYLTQREQDSEMQSNLSQHDQQETAKERMLPEAKVAAKGFTNYFTHEIGAAQRLLLTTEDLDRKQALLQSEGHYTISQTDRLPQSCLASYLRARLNLRKKFARGLLTTGIVQDGVTAQFGSLPNRVINKKTSDVVSLRWLNYQLPLEVENPIFAVDREDGKDDPCQLLLESEPAYFEQLHLEQQQIELELAKTEEEIARMQRLQREHSSSESVVSLSHQVRQQRSHSAERSRVIADDDDQAEGQTLIDESSAKQARGKPSNSNSKKKDSDNENRIKPGSLVASASEKAVNQAQSGAKLNSISEGGARGSKVRDDSDAEQDSKVERAKLKLKTDQKTAGARNKNREGQSGRLASKPASPEDESKNNNQKADNALHKTSSSSLVQVGQIKMKRSGRRGGSKNASGVQEANEEEEFHVNETVKEASSHGATPNKNLRSRKKSASSFDSNQSDSSEDNGSDDDFQFGKKKYSARKHKERDSEQPYQQKIWTEEEKKIYVEQVKIVGQNMAEIQKHIPYKTVAQCRNFWMNNHVKLNLKKLAPSDKLLGYSGSYNSHEGLTQSPIQLDSKPSSPEAPPPKPKPKSKGSKANQKKTGPRDYSAQTLALQRWREEQKKKKLEKQKLINLQKKSAGKGSGDDKDSGRASASKSKDKIDLFSSSNKKKRPSPMLSHRKRSSTKKGSGGKSIVLSQIISADEFAGLAQKRAKRAAGGGEDDAADDDWVVVDEENNKIEGPAIVTIEDGTTDVHAFALKEQANVSEKVSKDESLIQASSHEDNQSRGRGIMNEMLEFIDIPKTGSRGHSQTYDQKMA